MQLTLGCIRKHKLAKEVSHIHTSNDAHYQEVCVISQYLCTVAWLDLWELKDSRRAVQSVAATLGRRPLLNSPDEAMSFVMPTCVARDSVNARCSY